MPRPSLPGGAARAGPLLNRVGRPQRMRLRPPPSRAPNRPRPRVAEGGARRLRRCRSPTRRSPKCPPRLTWKPLWSNKQWRPRPRAAAGGAWSPLRHLPKRLFLKPLSPRRPPPAAVGGEPAPPKRRSPKHRPSKHWPSKHWPSKHRPRRSPPRPPQKRSPPGTPRLCVVGDALVRRRYPPPKPQTRQECLPLRPPPAAVVSLARPMRPWLRRR